jgi:signal transduction histidine kinase
MEIKKYYQHMTNQLVIPDYSEHEEMHFYFPMFSEGSFYVVTESELSAGELQVVRRFSSVLSLTYRRFNDLKKAEAQAREAQIEAALERVRARTMAMQKSEELAEAAEEMFKQVNALGAPEWSCGFDIFDQDEKSVTQWISGGSGLLPPFKTPLTEHSFFKTQIEARHQKQDFMVMELGGQELEDLYDYIFQFPDAKKVIDHIKNAGRVRPEFQVMHFAFFSQGYLLFITYEPVPEMWDIFKRFAKVFEQTYTRFLDLQKAEAQAREAIKQASIDRIRAEIASMRTTGDLERITPLVWNELTTLGVPFIRCGVFIMDEEQQQVQSFLSTPDGKAIAAFRQPYNSPGEVSQVVEHWHQKKIYKQHWNEAEFIEFTKNLVQQGAITSGEKYLTENRPTDLYLHFLPFMQGMLYAGSTTALSDDELQLVQNLADAFATAYARYEDFNKLEVAKQQIEMTLDDLKQAQQQLVQSEKMASLGELTAGIAHEIQNPLNFVNNFSDVNKELLEELKEEADKGNIEEIKAIANDIINNEAKINHHGKRADAIVKNMLQHSRSSGATKELTDINKLADEYLRLSYHGLRAKDKSFNSDFKTYFDGNIGKVNVIPQDIGRVLLNLFNNAFYAVNEKLRAQSSQLTADYKPLVSVQTKKIKDKIELRVSDNGNGIPRNIVDKIFQPFFTTKPTGQGTGLGLSLSYDIIKAHGGEIKVETREGEGSEFVIQLICGN